MEKKKRKEWIRPYAWSAPSLLLIGLMVVFPILYTFYISLTNMTSLSLSALRKEGLEPSRSKAITGSLVLRVCQFRHPRDWVPY